MLHRAQQQNLVGRIAIHAHGHAEAGIVRLVRGFDGLGRLLARLVRKQDGTHQRQGNLAVRPDHVLAVHLRAPGDVDRDLVAPPKLVLLGRRRLEFAQRHRRIDR
jgi:hypothetical protein